MPRHPSLFTTAVTGIMTTALAAAGLAVLAPPVHGQPEIGPGVKVNNVGYVPGLPKQATVVHGSVQPVAWSLRDSSGQEMAAGTTTVVGADQASGDHVHEVDFSRVDTPGTGYTLAVDGEVSYPFDIAAEPYLQLRHDALAFYYHQRSGTPIEAQYVGDEYARPAGHVNQPPNTGDDDVGCRPASPCDYTLDVRGGWYDAGDHGKYVVNGGISTWQLLNAYERTLHTDDADPDALGDGTLAIPESGNGAPDILDEARWNVEFLLAMQVPEGRARAGMVHHKIHDENWTGIPTLPHQDSQQRYLAPPSTAATLNLAAVAAQCARIWADVDAVFAATCLDAAERAYAAAQANPDIIAPEADGQGGGAYSDSNLADEFYWAAAELFTTTGESSYRADLTGHALYHGESFSTRGADWANTGLLGDITLAVIPNSLPNADITTLRDAFADFGDTLLDVMDGQGYPVPYWPQGSGGLSYDWGSNNLVLNNTVVLALAFDITGDTRYRDGVFAALDYTLGRNPLSQSYITGYGEQAARNVHHRFWANQADQSLPTAPPGVLAGGPNSGLQDPLAAAELAGCSPQKCYLDHIDSWSTNEVTINWNSVLSWVAVWAGEHVAALEPGEPDTEAPTQPGAPTSSEITSSSAVLTWPASADDVGVAAYDVYRDAGSSGDELLATTRASSAELTGLTPETEYTVYVVARDAAGNESPPSSPTTFTTQPDDGGGGDEACAVDYDVAWDNGGGGFGADLTVTNLGDPIDGWTVEFTFPADQRVDQGWSAQWSQPVGSGEVSVANLSWNARLDAGASVSLGFNGSYGSSNPDPTEFALNGVSCVVG
ncbi:glycoside hydrolase family 9 protein [Phytoactinopolyspora halotolerans]|uniref:Endoglucanase n=1 Tax=Phytoactinopolyspora halotolerans TaxID=1981512 RepID=A0A6L9SJ31_9ACTN|nr:glycoside hydrolase family 9 protein [Phytoactinopolyspora halotolerans]NEE04698.1 endoglucanase [Phytoactinopolyspora halotolerans]